MVSEHNEELKTKQFNFQERGKLGARRMESSGWRQKQKDLISTCYFEGSIAPSLIRLMQMIFMQ